MHAQTLEPHIQPHSGLMKMLATCFPEVPCGHLRLLTLVLSGQKSTAVCDQQCGNRTGHTVTPAKAGVQALTYAQALKSLDSRLRGKDGT